MTVARYLERQGLMEDCITWLQHHYPKVKYFLQKSWTSFIVFYLVLPPGGANALWQASSSITASQAWQDKDEASVHFTKYLFNQNLVDFSQFIFAIQILWIFIRIFCNQINSSSQSLRTKFQSKQIIIAKFLIRKEIKSNHHYNCCNKKRNKLG